MLRLVSTIAGTLGGIIGCSYIIGKMIEKQPINVTVTVTPPEQNKEEQSTIIEEETIIVENVEAPEKGAKIRNGKVTTKKVVSEPETIEE